MSRKNARTVTRPQTSKGRAGDNSGGNREYVQAMQGLRRSNATTPVPSGRRYVRRTRNNSFPEA
jgi:hypothetical protein